MNHSLPFHSSVLFLFWGFAVVSSGFLYRMDYMLISLFAGMLYGLLAEGKKIFRAWREPFLFAAAVLLMSLVFGNRENKVYYGFLTGGVFAASFLWIRMGHRLMSSDRVYGLLGSAAPKTSLLFVMILHDFSHLKRISQSRLEARAGIGCRINLHQFHEACEFLTFLTAAVLEESITAAVSMKSRGYGSGRRSCYQSRLFGQRDAAGMAAVTVGIVSFILCRCSAYENAARLLYLVLLCLPTAEKIREKWIWKCCQSRI